MKHNLREYYLAQLGIPIWYDRNRIVPVSEVSNENDVVSNIQSISIPEAEIPIQNANLLNSCQSCKLNHTHQIVARGESSAPIVIISEAPTHQEEISGQALSNEAYLLLSKGLKIIGLDEKQYYITPYIKCYAHDTLITVEEEENCFTTILQTELANLAPKLIILLGRNVTRFFLNTETSFDQLRGTTHHSTKLSPHIPFVVTYNPYQLLKFPKQKQKFWEDLKYIHTLIQDIV